MIRLILLLITILFMTSSLRFKVYLINQVIATQGLQPFSPFNTPFAIPTNIHPLNNFQFNSTSFCGLTVHAHLAPLCQYPLFVMIEYLLFKMNNNFFKFFEYFLILELCGQLFRFSKHYNKIFILCDLIGYVFWMHSDNRKAPKVYTRRPLGLYFSFLYKSI